MADVPHDQDSKTFEEGRPRLEAGRVVTFAQDLSNREGVQQALRGMLVLTIAPVDDPHVRHVAADLQRGAT